MMRYVKSSARLLLCCTLICGCVYPFVVWVVSHFLVPSSSEVERVVCHGREVGLRFIGQTFVSERYFWSRPSMVQRREDSLLVSRASNLSWSSPLLRATCEARVASVKGALGEAELLVPDDLVMASASGLDPDISLNAALVQIPRVAKVRSISEEELRALIFHLEEPALLGLFPRRINVLVLNCALDQHYGQETN